MSDNVSFISANGSKIGGSFSILKKKDKVIGIDAGATLDGSRTDFSITDHVDHLILTHGHRDHVASLIDFIRLFPDTKIWATRGTIRFLRILLEQKLSRALDDNESRPFESDEMERAINSVHEISSEKPEILEEGLTVYPIPAGHILDSIQVLINWDGDFFFFTGDSCYEDRNLLMGAPKLTFPKMRALFRESTCINEVKNRKKSVSGLKSASRKDILNDHQILIAALAIDRAQDVFAIVKEELAESCLDVPIYIDGSRRQFKVYRELLGEKAAVLDQVMWFRNDYERLRVLESGNPAIIIASSGMMDDNTPSSRWAEEFLWQKNKSIFFVNYLDLASPGYKLANSQPGQILKINNDWISVRCEIKKFDLSAHMDKKDGEELEERSNAETIVYMHGDESNIDQYLKEHQNGRRRVKAEAGKEVPL